MTTNYDVSKPVNIFGDANLPATLSHIILGFTCFLMISYIIIFDGILMGKISKYNRIKWFWILYLINQICFCTMQTLYWNFPEMPTALYKKINATFIGFGGSAVVCLGVSIFIGINIHETKYYHIKYTLILYILYTIPWLVIVFGASGNSGETSLVAFWIVIFLNLLIPVPIVCVALVSYYSINKQKMYLFCAISAFIGCIIMAIGS